MQMTFIDFCNSIGITKYQRERRKEELLLWLENFYEYELINSKPLQIIIKQQLNEYRPLPRKTYNIESREKLTQEKKKDYELYTIEALGVIYKPNSQSKIAREAIADFGNEKYGHIDQKKVVRNYIKEPFYKYGESEDKYIWVWYTDYSELELSELKDWKNILKNNKIDSDSAANAFYRQEQGEDIVEEKNYYKQALKEIRKEYKDIPVLVKRWKLKT